MSTPPQQPAQPADRPPQPGPPAHPPSVPPQPTAYPYPSPQSPPPSPQSPPPGPFLPPPMPSGPQPGNPYAQPPQYGLPPVPPTAAGGGTAGRAVLWAVVGAVVASVAWAAGVFLTGAAAGAADLRGYAAPSDLCSRADYTSFKDEYTAADSAPTHSSLKDTALNESYCSASLKKSGSSYADAYLAIQLDLHRKTDPGPEFTATWKNYADSHTGYDVDPVEDIGDEAYLVSRDTTSGTSSGSRYATLAVRDGWVTYTMSYSAYLSSYDSDKDPPKIDAVSDWLKTDTRNTLDRLKG
ncbi:hypothetical protein ACFWN1_15670 [Streptomyces sp. NPDC058459]|uniref:hypothetical protein n=1 Tax=Streptomyces sp. NPDC058459 TaxID=3346508 RepID=UPI00364B5A11